MDYPRDHEGAIKARQAVAGKAGFIFGCVAAIVAAVINLSRTPRPLTLIGLLLAVLLAALNVPIGIALGLMGERLTRKSNRP